MCEIFNHYSTGLFTCLVSIRSRRQETLKNSYTGTTDVACMQEMGIVTNASCLFSKCPTKVIIIVQTSNFAVLCINHHSTGKLKYFHVRRCLFEVLIAQDHEKSHCRTPPAFQDVCWNLSSRSDGRWRDEDVGGHHPHWVGQQRDHHGAVRVEEENWWGGKLS